MSTRQCFLLSPYRLPTHSPVYLDADEVSCWLNGYLALWHPAALLGAAGPPQIASGYDHNDPLADCLYAVPESPQQFLPDDWVERVRNARSAHLHPLPDASGTADRLLAALEQLAAPSPLRALGAADLLPFRAIGLGYLYIETLFDAMEHEHLLNHESFWGHVSTAVASAGTPAAIESLRQAAEVLADARTVLYPSSLNLLEFIVLDEAKPSAAWPPLPAEPIAPNLIANGPALARLAQDAPELLLRVRERLSGSPPTAELLGGLAIERYDALLPIESQLWNWQRGRQQAIDALNVAPLTHARSRGGFHPLTPAWQQVAGLTRALFWSGDGSQLPAYNSAAIGWPAPSGRQVEAFCREPHPAHEAKTFFNLPYHLRQAISTDTTPTMAIMHRDGHTPAVGYAEFLSLTRLSGALGQWQTLNDYFREAVAGEYISPPDIDEFFCDALEARVQANHTAAVSAFADATRTRRLIDAAHTYAALGHSLGLGVAASSEYARLREIEDSFEVQGTDISAELSRVSDFLAGELAKRLTAKGSGGPGWLAINPCSFTRRVALEIPGAKTPITVGGPVKAAELVGGIARVVVEIPGLGFAWIPEDGTVTKPRLSLADGLAVRNEFVEAELDPSTGGLRAFRDMRTRRGRLGQQLVYNPVGTGTARATSVTVTHSGAALGEVTSSGQLLDEQQQRIADFRQRLRVWAARPLVEVRLELQPSREPHGYAWHAYYGARFAWREEQALIYRGMYGAGTLTRHNRPLVPDFLEIRSGKDSTAILTGGLPFSRRPDGISGSNRMLDLILRPPGEKANVFEWGLVLDRDNLPAAALGFVSPTAVVRCERGPHIGPVGWLYFLDAPNVQITSLRPSGPGRVEVIAVETSIFGGGFGLRCPRNVTRAVVLDPDGEEMTSLPVEGDGFEHELTAGELVRLRVELE